MTGKLEKDHVQTFGYEAFQALVRRYLAVRRTLGVYLFVEQDIDALPRTLWGRLRMALYLRAGRFFPARSVNVIVESSKFHAQAIFRIARLDKVTRVITDAGIDPGTRQEIEKAGVEVLVAAPEDASP